MKTTYRFSMLCAVLLAVAARLYAQTELRPDYQPMVPGLEYAHVATTNWDNGEPWSIHIARLDRSRKDLHVASMLSQNEVFGIAAISVQASSVPSTTGIPLVAINTDFCIIKRDPYQGASRGLQIMQGEFVSPPFKWSFWVNEDGTMAFGEVGSKCRATLPGGQPFPIGLNHECKPNAVVLFTHMLGKSTRATNHLELVLEDLAHHPLSWRAGGSYSLRVRAVNPAGNSPLSSGTAVLCFGAKVVEKAGQPKPGDEVRVDLATEPDLSKAVTGSACIFPLILNGAVLKEFEGGKYLLQKHPRTAIGFNSRYFYQVVVDGRQKALSMGMYPKELAQFMAKLGCTDAMNMDGGGSSTFWLTGKVRNSPCDKHERHLANGMVIVQRAAP